MIISSIEDIIYLKDSQILLQKINKIKSVFREFDCEIETIPAPVHMEENKATFEMTISFRIP